MCGNGKGSGTVNEFTLRKSVHNRKLPSDLGTTRMEEAHGLLLFSVIPNPSSYIEFLFKNSCLFWMKSIWKHLCYEDVMRLRCAVDSVTYMYMYSGGEATQTAVSTEHTCRSFTSAICRYLPLMPSQHRLIQIQDGSRWLHQVAGARIRQW